MITGTRGITFKFIASPPLQCIVLASFLVKLEGSFYLQFSIISKLV